MSATFKVTAPCGCTKEFETKAEAEEGIDTHEALCPECEPGEADIETVETDVPDVVNDKTGLPDDPPVDTDPLTWIPEEFQDTIDGTIAINRKGFEVLAHHYNIATETDMVEYSEERVVHKAKATTEDGKLYTAYGEAHVDEVDSEKLVRMSDTRAYKRAVSRATGVGMIAVSELQAEL